MQISKHFYQIMTSFIKNRFDNNIYNVYFIKCILYFGFIFIPILVDMRQR